MALPSQLRQGQLAGKQQPPRSMPAGVPAAPKPLQQQQRQQQVLRAAAADAPVSVDQTLNPLVASLSVSKTMALTDLARSMKESGIDVSSSSSSTCAGMPYAMLHPLLCVCCCAALWSVSRRAQAHAAAGKCAEPHHSAAWISTRCWQGVPQKHSN
jgi:hypothetical protein